MLRVNIVGIGPGNPELLTAAARRAIEESTILIGDRRMLAAFAAPGKQLYATIKTARIAELAAAADPEQDRLAVLVSGDVGFFSLAQSISGKLPDCECVRYCGISSLVYFAARLNMSWEDAKIVSMHGRRQNLVAAVAHNRKVFALTGGEHTPQALCAALCAQGLETVQVYVGEDLSYPQERITVATAAEVSRQQFSPLCVLMFINAAPIGELPGVHGLADELFVRGKVPMTKQEVRSVSLSKLAPQPEETVFDIGAGTGSCSVELALLARRGRVLAFERNPEALALLQKNKERFAVDNLEIIPGEALENIGRGPAPDCVFIGGSGGHLAAMLDSIYAANPACRVVINAITVETLAETATYYREHSDYSLEIVNLFAARAKKLGSYNLMLAQNPVYIITALPKEDHHG